MSFWPFRHSFWALASESALSKCWHRLRAYCRNAESAWKCIVNTQLEHTAKMLKLTESVRWVGEHCHNTGAECVITVKILELSAWSLSKCWSRVLSKRCSWVCEHCQNTGAECVNTVKKLKLSVWTLSKRLSWVYEHCKNAEAKIVIAFKMMKPSVWSLSKRWCQVCEHCQNAKAAWKWHVYKH